MMFTRVLVIIAILLGMTAAHATTVLRLDDATPRVELVPWAEVLEDKHSDMTAEQVLTIPDHQWAAVHEKSLNRGYTSSAYWLRFSIENPGDARRWWLNIDFPLLNDIMVFHFVDGTLTEHKLGGNDRLEQNDAVRSHHILFPLQFGANTHNTLVMRVKTESSMMLPMTLQTTTSLIERGSSELLWFGIFYGFMGALLFYHIFVLFTFRDAEYSLLTAILGGIIVGSAMLNGIAHLYLFTYPTGFSAKLIPVSLSLTGLGVLVLLRKFSGMTDDRSRMDDWLRYGIAIAAFSVVISLLGDYRTGTLVSIATLVGVIGLGLHTSYVSRRNGYAPATLFLAAWIMLSSGLFGYLLRLLGMFDSNAPTEKMLHFSLMSYTLLIAFSLTDRLRLLQEKATRATRELAAVTERYNEDLESEVEARTRELAEEAEQYSEAQRQLVAQQRRQASGVMSAGIAHEINNPNNFISGGAQLLKKRIDDFASLIDELLDENAPDLIRNDISQRVEILRNRTTKIGESSWMISQIVQRFRSTTNADESDVLITDIVTRLENVLHTSKSGFSRPVHVRTEFPYRPEIKCRPMDCAHVFMDVVKSIADQSFEQPIGELRAESKFQDGKLMVVLTSTHAFVLEDDLYAKAESIMSMQKGGFIAPNEYTAAFIFAIR